MNTVDPTFSLVVSTLDRAVPLRTLLRSLEHQAYTNFEVIVVVGPTHDDTLQVLDEYAGRVRILRCPTANLGRSRNIGLLEARGDIVAFLDDDAVPCRRWFEQLAHILQNETVDGSGGVVYAIHPDFALTQFRLGIYSSLSEQVDARASWLDHLVPPGRGSQWLARLMGTNMAFRREALLGIGGFDEFYRYLADDCDVVFRMANQGHLVVPVKEAPVYHIPASSRNRIVFTHKVKWWLRSSARIYFVMKNGAAAGESVRSMMWRNFLSIGAHWLLYWQAWRAGKLWWSDALVGSVREMGGWLEGTLAGLMRPRQLIPMTTRVAARQLTQPIQRFQNEWSIRQAAVDPVTGQRPSISLPDAPLRICLLSGAYPPVEYGGLARLTNLMARGLFERGHTVHVIARGEREQTSFYDGAYVHRIVPRLDRYMPYRQSVNLWHALNYSHAVCDKVKRLLLNDGVQIVDSPLWLFEGLVTQMSGIAPVVLRVITALRQINEIHKSRSDEMELMSDLEQQLLRRAAHVIPNTQATLDAMSKVYGLAPGIPHTIVPYGIVPVSDDAIRPPDPSRRPDSFTVLYVGRLEKRKGILDLFQAIPRVLARDPRVRFVIVGADNSQHDGFQIETGMTYPEYFLQHYARYTAQVNFMGAVSDEDLQRYYAACDLFVAPSRYESFGLIYLEAMNYAKPVIGCRAGGIPEVVNDGVTGVLVDPAAPVALAEAILSLFQSPEKLYELGMAGRELLLRDFTHVQMARRFEQVYRQVISESQRGR